MKTHKKIKDHFLTKEVFSLVRHDEGVLRTTPKLTDALLSKYYDSEQYASHNNVQGVLGFVYTFISKQMLKIKFRIIKRHIKNNGLVVDFGCGKGDFVSYVKGQNIKAVGVENNRSALEVCKKRQLNVLDSISNIKSEINVITFWHSFEHLSKPEKIITAIKNYTNKDSIVVIALPNFKSFDAKYYDKFWAAYDVPRHRFHYSKFGIKQTMKKLGFQCVNTKPMFFDALYISMISEKFKNNKLFFVKGLVVGVISNFVGFFNSNYSSNIFVFKKAI